MKSTWRQLSTSGAVDKPLPSTGSTVSINIFSTSELLASEARAVSGSECVSMASSVAL